MFLKRRAHWQKLALSTRGVGQSETPTPLGRYRELTAAESVKFNQLSSTFSNVAVVRPSF